MTGRGWSRPSSGYERSGPVSRRLLTGWGDALFELTDARLCCPVQAQCRR